LKYFFIFISTAHIPSHITDLKMTANSQIATIIALVIDLVNKSSQYEVEIGATLDTCIDSLNLLLKSEAEHPATAPVEETTTNEEEESENEESEESEDEEDEPQYTFACCGKDGAYDPEDICSACITRPYKNILKIEKVFAPQSEKEMKDLMTIAEESRWIDIKPYSHNIVGLSLRILDETHKYDEEKIKLVVKTFGLNKKGWGYLVGEEED